jgi:hypothetical protein
VTDADRVHAAWAAMADDAEDAGFALRAADTPRSAGAWLIATAQLSQTAGDEVRTLARAEERARYARACPDPSGLDATVVAIRKALVANAPWGRRLRILMLPTSTLRQAREGASGAFDQVIRRRDQAYRWVVRRLTRRAVA